MNKELEALEQKLQHIEAAITLRLADAVSLSNQIHALEKRVASLEQELQNLTVHRT